MYQEVSPELLLALMSAKLEPLFCCSDGRWRSAVRLFPARGISDGDVEALIADALAERIAQTVVLTERGLGLLRGGVCITRASRRDEAATVLN